MTPQPRPRHEAKAVSVERLLRSLGVEAERQDREWVGRCPSGKHADAHPSFHVHDDPSSPKHGLFACWSCGASGTAVALVRLVKPELGWREAYDWVIVYAHADVAPPALEVEVKQPRLYENSGFQMPYGVAQPRWAAWGYSVAIDYVLKRGIAPWQVDRWRIGYGFAGRLVNRLVIPIERPGNLLVGYSARAMVDGMVPRYLTPPAGEHPYRGVVFGERYWRSPSDAGLAASALGAPQAHLYMRRPLVLCEGAIDALAVERLGGDALSVGALSGSKMLPEHVLKLGVFPFVVVLTDDDPAGNEVAAKLTAALSSARVARALLPKGEDAASVDPEVLRRVLVEAGVAAPLLRGNVSV